MPILPTPIPIVVLAGQSNANNAAIITATFQRVAASGGLMVHQAVNGSPLSSTLDGGRGDWSAGRGADQGELLDRLNRQLDSILNPASSSYVPGAFLDSVIWIHGGADIFTRSAANSYQANLSALNASLTTRYGAHDLVIGGMAEASYLNRNLPSYQATNWKTVQKAQETLAAADPRIVLVNPDTVAQAHRLTAQNMFQSDYIHYTDNAGFATLFGRALANAALPGLQANALFSQSLGGERSYRTGTGGNDSFTLPAAGLAQVLGGGGFDRVSLADRASGVTLTMLSETNHRITGNAGGPSLFVDLMQVESIRLTSGKDRVALGGSLTEVYTLGGADVVGGSWKAETIYLGDGHDYAFSSGGNDRIYGENGADTLWASTGNDQLFGGFDDDRLFGGAGNDTLSGGPGRDQFVFFPSEGSDVVTDFQNGTDTLWMRGQGWGDLRFTAQGNHTLVQGLNVSVLLHNVTVQMLDAGDFIFSA